MFAFIIIIIIIILVPVYQKTISVVFPAIEDFDMEAKCERITLSKEAFSRWWDSKQVSSLKTNGSAEVYDFNELKEDIVYRAKFKFQDERHRHQIDDQVAELEALESLRLSVLPYFPDAHTHSSFELRDGKKSIAEYDGAISLIHSSKENISGTTCLLMDTKYKVHIADVERVLKRVAVFQNYIKEKKEFEMVSTSLNYREPLGNFSHFHGVDRVIPCLSGVHFNKEVKASCAQNGIVTIFPSGSRYLVKSLKLLLQITKK